MSNSISDSAAQADLPKVVQLVHKDAERHCNDRAQELENSVEDNPLPKGFFISNENLLYQRDAKGDQQPPEATFICSRLDVIACTRDDANQNHGRLLSFKDIDGFHHEWAMPMELLAGDGTRYREELLSKGLFIATGTTPRQYLTYYIQSSKPRARARCVSRTGWHNNCFVFPDQSIGNSGQERVILQTTSLVLPDYSSSGLLDEWKNEIAALCIGNSRLTFSVSLAFAPPLLNLLGLESGGFHLRGPSSTGKTTALMMAGSVWGGKNYVQRWRTTTNGIEALAAGYNDALLCLDELSQVDPAMAGEIAYMLANGEGKVRADRHGHPRKKATWRLIFLSTGEVSLADHMIEAGKRAKAGQEVRIIDIAADTQKHGIFENLHGHVNAAALSRALTLACQKYHGTAAREFLTVLMNNQEEAVLQVNRFIREFTGNCVLNEASGQVHRVAIRFAIIAAAGELATAFGVTPWKNGDALSAAKTCLSTWLVSRGGVGSQEEQAILSQIRRFFEQHGESRFTPWNADLDQKTIYRAGYRKINENCEIEFYVLPETFKAELASGHDPTLVMSVCVKQGLLKLGSNGEATRSERLPHMSRNTRCYRFTSKVLGDDESSCEA